jgi:hypothetical protein
LIWAKAVASSKWLPWHQELCVAAAAGNQLATLQELRTGGGPEQQWEVVKVAAKAAEYAGLPMLQWIMEQQPEWTAESAQPVVEGAAQARDAIDKITWLSQRFPAERGLLRLHFLIASIKCGAVQTLKWFASQSSGVRCNDQVFTNIAFEAGQLARCAILWTRRAVPGM